MASIRGILNIQSLNELTFEKVLVEVRNAIRILRPTVRSCLHG